MMKVNCILYIISPTHFISAISAVSSIYPPDRLDVKIFLQYWPGLPQNIGEEIENIIRQFSKRYSFINNIVTIDNNLFSIISSNPSESLKKLADDSKPDELYYPHDVGLKLYDYLANSYPEAKRICYGDALGTVFEKEVHLSLLKIRSEPTPQEHRPHKAALILPIDQSGNFLKNIPFIVSRRDVFFNVVENCIYSASKLQNYIESILEDYRNSKKYLLLTENFAEANRIDFYREIAMWCSIIEDACTPGSVIFLKSHPGENLQRNKRISEMLSGRYEVVELDEKYKRYPIEIWKKLILSCEIVCTGYPTLSLKYLYNKDVINPINDVFIEKWFPKRIWDSSKNAYALYMEPLKNLDGWDGKSVLYSGNLKI